MRERVTGHFSECCYATCCLGMVSWQLGLDQTATKQRLHHGCVALSCAGCPGYVLGAAARTHADPKDSGHPENSAVLALSSALPSHAQVHRYVAVSLEGLLSATPLPQGRAIQWRLTLTSPQPLALHFCDWTSSLRGLLWKQESWMSHETPLEKCHKIVDQSVFYFVHSKVILDKDIDKYKDSGFY